MSQNASPPMPQPLGMTTARTAFVAIAASTAEPPARSKPSPAAVARWWGATTAPWRPRARGAGTRGPCDAVQPARRGVLRHGAPAVDAVRPAVRPARPPPGHAVRPDIRGHRGRPDLGHDGPGAPRWDAAARGCLHGRERALDPWVHRRCDGGQ